MIKQYHIRNFIFVLLAGYFAQGSLYAQGSIISVGILVVVLAISLIYFFKCIFLKKEKDAFFIIWTILFLLNSIGFFLTGDISNPYHFTMLKGTLITLLLFYPVYYFSIYNVMTSEFLVRFMIVMIPLFILQFYLHNEQVLDRRLSDRVEVVNNVSYFFVGLIPYVFLIKKNKLIAISVLLVLVYFIIQSAKRGALISGSIGLMFFFYYSLITIDKKNRLLGYSLILLGIVGIVLYSYYQYESNAYLVSRMQSVGDGGYSGRDLIFANIWDNWLNSDKFLAILFGYGYASSLELSGTGHFAHNDWLELLANFGALGFFIYVVLFVSLFVEAYVSKNRCTRVILLAVLFIILFNTIVYRFYSGNDGFLYSIILAFLVGSTRSIKVLRNPRLNMF